MRSPWRTLSDRLNERARLWALRRQGSDPPQLTLAPGRIYILPTLPGLLYAAMLATMLAGAMNYNNNLAFALTFLLAGAAVAGIYHTHRVLAGLRIRYLGAEPVFAGDPLEVRFALVNDAGEPRDEIFLDWEGGAELPGSVGARESRTVRMPLATHRRGPRPLPGLRLATRAPLGLMRAWAWVHMEPRPLVYPRPAADAADGARPPDHAPEPGPHDRGDDDFAGLRAYQPGDSPRRVAWKQYARSGELLVRELRGGNAQDCLWLDWDAVPGDAEARASRLARLVLDAQASAAPWGLRLPGIRLEPASGREHLHACLAALATAGGPGEAR